MEESRRDPGKALSVTIPPRPPDEAPARPPAPAGPGLDGGDRLRRLLTIQDELIRQALDGAGLDRLAGEVAGRLGNPVLVESRFGRVLAFAHPLSSPTECPVPSFLGLRAPALRAEAARVSAGRSPLRLPPGSLAPRASARVVAPIVVDGSTVGYLSIVEQFHPADAETVELAGRLAQGFGIVFARLRAALDVESRYRDNLLDALVLADDVDENWAVARGSLLDYDLTAPQSLLLLGLDPADPPIVPPPPTELVELLTPWATGVGRGGVVGVKDGAVVVLVAAAGGERGSGGGRRGSGRASPRLDRPTARLVDGIRREIGPRYPGLSVSVVAAPAVSDWRELRRAYRVARQSLRVLRRVGERGVAISTADPRLALFFLLDGADPATVAGFVDRILGTLLAYDLQHRRSLVETLEAYLGEYGNLESTARRLNIHTSTLKYRLARISELSGLDLRNADHRFNATLALRLRALRPISDE